MASTDATAESVSTNAVRMETGLHSPPETNMKDTDSDSELSDLEPEHDKKDELEDVQPDHYSPDGTVPVFRPTMEEFEDFQRYMRGIHSFGMRHGIVKVIPPPEWLANQPRLDDIVKTIRIKEPIAQEIMGSNGTYRQANILHGRSYNLPQWRQLCDQSEHQPPAKRGERRANADKPATRATKVKAAAIADGDAPRKKPGRPGRGKGKSNVLPSVETVGNHDRLPTPESPSIKPTDRKPRVKKEQLGDDECNDKPRGGRQPKAISVSSRRKYSRREGSAAIDEEAFKGFNYELEGVDYSQERCDELERSYWKSLTYAPPLYGADMMGSLFDDRTTTWNLGKLDNILDVLGSKIPGVNTAYLYLGMWKATFAWHLEDVDLYSINYLHFGAPKQWYSISQGDARRFEAAMKTIWPADAKACDQFLRHKTFLISPSRLMENFNIKVNKVISHPGEFVITFPYGYHSGYNLGYNCAEAVNFGMEEWLPLGRVAKKCDCSEAQDSVWIDVSAIDRKLRGESTEVEESDEEDSEEEEEEDGTIVATPIGRMGRMGGFKIRAPTKKRKRSKHDAPGDASGKKIRVRIRIPNKEPCVLCPNDIPGEPLLPTEDGRKAHRICALYIPETSISEEGTPMITDIRYIDKARMELKCNYCRSKKGACFQCSQKKCTRAYHATCAAAAGVFVEQGETPVFGEDGTEYKDWGIEFSCRFHRAKRDHKKWDSEALDGNERTLRAAFSLKVGDTCQLQYYRDDIFAGTVVENRRSEEMLLIDIQPRGERVEVQYKWLLLPDPSDHKMVKPSANAIPMPKSFKDKESLNTTKRIEGDLPRPDDIFVKGGFTWAEFNTANFPRNRSQVKINLSKEEQIWYYLGKTSTEAKAQFTEAPSRPRHNPRGHFLDTIPKPAPIIARQSFGAPYPTPQVSAYKSQTPIRPPLPRSNSSGSKDKPYVYKPRVSTYGENSYRIDQQAYQSQQSFLQNSQQRPSPILPPQYQGQNARAPYAFGTDPRWVTQQSKTSHIDADQGNGKPWKVTTTGGYSMQHATSNGGRTAPEPTHYSQYPGAKQPQASVAPQLSPTMPQFSQSQSRPTSSSRPQYSPSSTPQPQANSQRQENKQDFTGANTQIKKAQGSNTATNTLAKIPQQPYRPPILPPGSVSRHQHKASASSGAPKYQPPTATLSETPKPTQTATFSQPRPASANAPSQPTRPGNPFKAPPVSRPNVFAKYSYLQKEHNRSPLEYRSPYRPNGGFMNGYQGNLQEHMKQTLFQGRPTSSHSQSTDTSSLYGRRPSYTPSQPSQSSPIYDQATPVPYTSVYGRAPLQPSSTTPSSWDGKESSQLHPAIRQEYSTPYAPTQQLRPNPSLQSSPATYDRPSSQSSGTYYTPQYPPQPKQETRPVHASLSAAHPQTYNTIQRQVAHPQQAGEVRQSFHPKDASPPPPRVIETPKQTVQSKTMKRSKQLQNPPAVPDMATFKVPAPADAAMPTYTAKDFTDQPYYQNGYNQPQAGIMQTKTFTDVPVDSTSILERLFSNLRKVGESQAQSRRI